MHITDCDVCVFIAGRWSARHPHTAQVASGRRSVVVTGDIQGQAHTQGTGRGWVCSAASIFAFDNCAVVSHGVKGLMHSTPGPCCSAALSAHNTLNLCTLHFRPWASTHTLINTTLNCLSASRSCGQRVPQSHGRHGWLASLQNMHRHGMCSAHCRVSSAWADARWAGEFLVAFIYKGCWLYERVSVS